MEQQIATGTGKVIEFVLGGALDWRLWFVHAVSWMAIGWLKHSWDHVRPLVKRRRITEFISGLVAAILTARVFYGDPMMLEYMLFNFFANPIIYKIVVGVVSWKFPIVSEWLGFKRYEVRATANGGIAIREDGEKTIILTPKKVKAYRETEK